MDEWPARHSPFPHRGVRKRVHPLGMHILTKERVHKPMDIFEPKAKTLRLRVTRSTQLILITPPSPLCPWQFRHTLPTIFWFGRRSAFWLCCTRTTVSPSRLCASRDMWQAAHETPCPGYRIRPVPPPSACHAARPGRRDHGHRHDTRGRSSTAGMAGVEAMDLVAAHAAEGLLVGGGVHRRRGVGGS
jgi:hypothetical protein